MKKIVVLAWAAAFSVSALLADGEGFRFNRMYSSHMVLQRGEPVRVCGFAEAGRTVEVRFRGALASAQTAADGRWAVTLPPGAAGGPFVLEAREGERVLALEDVMVGDVWFCTGQSNMWWPMCNSGDPEKEIAAADHPNVRLLDVALTGAEEETDEPPYVRGWSRCTPLSARNFSACGYHFARTLREKLGDVPVGLIGAGWGGPPISHFLPPPKGGRNAEYLAKSRAAMAEAAKGFAEEDRLREVCRVLFADERAMAERAAETPDASRGGTVELPAKKGINHTILAKFAGAVHFRRTFPLDAAWEKRAAVLLLGAGDLPGVVYVNGRKVAAFKDWQSPVPGKEGGKAWKVTLAPGTLKAGENRVDVLLGCNDRLTWWSAFNGALSLTDAADAARTVSLAGDWAYDRFIDIPAVPRTYGGSWCARIHPFFQLPVKGVIFYQGEADASSHRSAAAYLADQMRLIGLLRDGWKKDDLPFYCMQLANHASKGNDTNRFSEIREAQRLTAELVPTTGCAVSIDIGSDLNIHPENKREQGRRLALQALAKTYGCKDVVAEGPVFDRVIRRGRTAEVVFKASSSPLVVKGGKLTGFEARPAGGAWRPVKAEVAGDRVKLSASCEIADVRYLWRNFPDPSAALFNAAGLPAGPFRALAAPLCAGGCMRMFRDGDRVAFFGDSITHGGAYARFLADYYLTRFPEADIRFINSGSGGDNSRHAQTRVAEDLIARRPNVVSVMFGMNDFGFREYGSHAGPEQVAAQRRRQGEYAQNMRDLVDLIAKSCELDALYLLTPTPFDDTAVYPEGRKVNEHLGAQAGLGGCAASVRALAAEKRLPFVDLYTVVADCFRTRRRADPAVTFASDRIHPCPGVHLLMALTYLEAQNADRVVSDVALQDGRVTKSVKATVSNVTTNAAGGVAFTILERSLPMPFDLGETAGFTNLPQAVAFNQQLLTFYGLKEGDWTLVVDGQKALTASAREWELGVNLAFNPLMPQYRQAQEVGRENHRRADRHGRILASVSGIRRTVRDRMTRAGLDYRSPADRAKYLEGLLPKLQPWDVKPWKLTFERWDAFEDDVSACLSAKEWADLRALAKPKPHRYELVPAAASES